MNKLIAILALAIIAWFIYSQNRETSQPPPVATISRLASVKERLEALVNTDPVDAWKLATLTAESPSDAVAVLRDRHVTLAGTVHSFHLTGSQRNILKVTLNGAGITRVCLTFNRRKHNAMSTHVDDGSYYDIIGADVLFFKKRGDPAEVVFQKGAPLRQKAFFQRLAASEIHFLAE